MVEMGTNRLVASERDSLVGTALAALNGFHPSAYGRPEQWDGRAAERIVKVLESWERNIKRGASPWV